MLNKDLNLSLNQILIKSGRVSETNNTSDTLASLNSKSPPKPQILPRSYKVGLHQMLIGVVVANAVFLLALGFWLAESFDQKFSASRTNPKAETTTKAVLVNLEEQITTLQQQLNDQGEVLQQQLHNLQLVFRVDQQQIVSDYLDMVERFQPVIPQPQKPTQPMTPQTSATTSLNNWYVNIGTFVNRKAAVGLQQQIVDLGYPATISSLTLNGKTAQRVQVAGFSDRASAEAVAQNIMKTTKLNGLWAWKGQ